MQQSTQDFSATLATAANNTIAVDSLTQQLADLEVEIQDFSKDAAALKQVLEKQRGKFQELDI